MGFWADYKADYANTKAKAKAIKKDLGFTTSVPTFPDNYYLENVNQFKSKFGIWEEWTGARYACRDNPNPTKDTNLKAVCRNNPVTGEWEAV